MNIIFLNTHPIQYLAPMYAWFNRHGQPCEAWYGSLRGAEMPAHDKEFGASFSWDIPLLEGYPYRVLPGSGWRAVSTLYRWLRETPKSLIWVHSWNHPVHFMALIIGRLLGHTTAVRGDSAWVQEQLKPRWKRFLRNGWLRLLFLFTRYALVVGRENRLFYKNLGLPDHRLLWTPYAVDNERFQAMAQALPKAKAREQTGLPGDDFVILFSAKYIEKKRPLDLLEAFHRLQGENLHLVLVGEGELRHQMESFIHSHGLQEKVTLTGFINQGDIPLYYHAADLLVMCSGRGENWGLSVNEAMNFSLPVVVSHLCGCAADLVKPGINGWIFPAGDAEALHQCLAACLTTSSEAREAMGQASLDLVNEYSFTNILQGIQRVNEI